MTSNARGESSKRTAARSVACATRSLIARRSQRASRTSGPRLARLLVGGLTAATVLETRRIIQRRALLQWAAPSGAVTHGALAARSLGSSGPPVVLLHGMGGSNIYWGAQFDTLADGARLVAVDLLGFGESPKPDVGYSPRHHADALAACLRELDINEPAVVVGHSMGTLVALALATYHPELVDSVVAIAPPIYASRVDGIRHIRAMGTLEGLMAFGSTSRLMCGWMCRHRELAGRLAPLIEPSLPAPIVRAGVQHTWASYSQSMDELILACDAAGWLVNLAKPVRLIAALDDRVPDIPLRSRLRELNDLVTLDIWSQGGHHLLLTEPAKCVAAIRLALDDFVRSPRSKPTPAGAPPAQELMPITALLCETDGTSAVATRDAETRAPFSRRAPLKRDAGSSQ